MSRERMNKRTGEPIFGPPATTPEEAFLRFGNAMHWELYFLEYELREDTACGPDEFFDVLLNATLKRLPRAEHRLVAEFITQLTSGQYTFAEAKALWARTENDTHWISWDESDALIRFLLRIRDRIDPSVWPASRPRFKAN